MSVQQSRILGFSLSFCLATMTCFVSMNLNSRFQHRNETIAQQIAIVEGRHYLLDDKDTYFPEFQNRVLFPLVLKSAIWWSPNDTVRIYILLRFTSALSAFLVLWWVLTAVVRAEMIWAASGMMLMGYELIFTFNHGFEHPTDYFDMLFHSLSTAAAISRRRWLLFVIVIVTSFNRESSPFAGMIWFCLFGVRTARPFRLDLSEVAYSAVLSTVGLLAVWCIRYSFGGWEALTGQTMALKWLPRFLHEAVSKPSPFIWPILLVCMIVPIINWVMYNRTHVNDRDGRLVSAAVVIAVISGTFSIMAEVRTFIPAVTVAVIACVSIQTRAINTAAIPAQSVA